MLLTCSARDSTSNHARLKKFRNEPDKFLKELGRRGDTDVYSVDLCGKCSAKILNLMFSKPSGVNKMLDDIRVNAEKHLEKWRKEVR